MIIKPPSLDWSQLESLVKEEQRNGNAIASIIHRLKLDTNRITLMLSKAPELGTYLFSFLLFPLVFPPLFSKRFASNFFFFLDEEDEFDEDGGEGAQASVLVDIDVSLTAYANACYYYDQKRVSEEKKEKTLQAGTFFFFFSFLNEISILTLNNKTNSRHCC